MPNDFADTPIGTDQERLIRHLTQALINAYAALPVAEQEGPLGEHINHVLHEVHHVRRVQSSTEE